MTAALWHLTSRQEWDRAVAAGCYDRSTRGLSLDQVGFVHCSRPEQLPGVAAVVYAGCTDELVVLELDEEHLAAAGSPVRTEPADPDDPGSERYPHVHGPVPVAAVMAVRPARMVAGRLWVGEPG